MAEAAVLGYLCGMISLKKLKSEVQVQLKVVLVFIGILVAIIIIQEFLLQ
jgi:hypothetical protein